MNTGSPSWVMPEAPSPGHGDRALSDQPCDRLPGPVSWTRAPPRVPTRDSTALSSSRRHTSRSTRCPPDFVRRPDPEMPPELPVQARTRACATEHGRSLSTLGGRCDSQNVSERMWTLLGAPGPTAPARLRRRSCDLRATKPRVLCVMPGVFVGASPAATLGEAAPVPRPTGQRPRHRVRWHYFSQSTWRTARWQVPARAVPEQLGTKGCISLLLPGDPGDALRQLPRQQESAPPPPAVRCRARHQECPSCTGGCLPGGPWPQGAPHFHPCGQ